MFESIHASMANPGEISSYYYSTVQAYPAAVDAIWKKLEKRPVGGSNTFIGELSRFLRAIVSDLGVANSINELHPECRKLLRQLELAGHDFISLLEGYDDHWNDDHVCDRICSDMQGPTDYPSMWQTPPNQERLLAVEAERAKVRQRGPALSP